MSGRVSSSSGGGGAAAPFKPFASLMAMLPPALTPRAATTKRPAAAAAAAAQRCLAPTYNEAFKQMNAKRERDRRSRATRESSYDALGFASGELPSPGLPAAKCARGGSSFMMEVAGLTASPDKPKAAGPSARGTDLDDIDECSSPSPRAFPPLHEGGSSEDLS